ncbi:MAG: NADH-quinone oxidoreductase subunit NuoN [Burkholderiales bacterium]|nr:NADH-quinone oxidoreductase subunit NuoN [Burkholderiales bacterium]
MSQATFSFATLAPALPEILLLVLTSALLLIDAFLSERDRHITYWLAQVTLVGTAVLTGLMLATSSASVVTFNGMFVYDMMSQVLKIATLLTVAATLMLGRTYLELRGLLKGEFVTLALFGTLGMMVMISAHNFITLFLGLELMALSQYSIVALQRDSVRATEAAMKYFVLGALSSGLLLYGMSMIYGATGSLDITRVALALERGNAAMPILGAFGLVFVVAGVAFKLGNAPFHMWIPDVYHGAATPTTVLIGGAPKLAAFAFIMRLLAHGLQAMSPDWQQMLVILAIASMLLGNVVAIAQSNLKRMLAYSTISHMGFLVLGILSATETGYGASMFYAIAYTIMTLGSFGMILLLSRAGFEAENLDDFRGLNQRSKWFAFVMLVMMFSLTGLPPTMGFFAKLFVLQAVLDAGYTWLVVVAVLLSVVGAFYYLRVVKIMYMDAPVGEMTFDPRADTRWMLSATAVATLFFGLLPGPLLDLCARAITASL